MRSSGEHNPIETEIHINNYPSMANVQFSNLEFTHLLQRYKPSSKVAFTKRSMNMKKLFQEKIPDKYYDRRFEGFKLYNEEGQ